MSNPTDQGQKRDYNGNFRNQIQPPANVVGGSNKIVSHGTTEVSPQQRTGFGHSQLSAGSTLIAGGDARNVISYEAQYLPQKPHTPLQYNAAGYALSSTYDTSKRPPPIAIAVSVKTASPAPPIQGTRISLDTPEDIAAWIAERKKKWPTDANVERNKAEKAKSSTATANKRRRKQKSGRGEDHRTASQVRHPDERSQPSVTKSDPVDASTNLPTSQSVSLQPSSLDIALAALEGTIESEADAPSAPSKRDPSQPSAQAPSIAPFNAEEMDHTRQSEPAKVSVESAESESDSDSDSDSSDISSSSSDEEDAFPEVASSKAAITDTVILETAPTPSARPRRPCKYFRQGNCTRGQACTFSHDASSTSGTRGQGRPQQGQQNVKMVDDRYKWRKRKSLYDRLVEAELAKEAAVAASE